MISGANQEELDIAIDRADLLLEIERLKARVKDLEEINKQHQEINAELRKELKD